LTKPRQFIFSGDDADPVARDLDAREPLDAHEPVGLKDDPLDVDLDAWVDEPSTNEDRTLDGDDDDDATDEAAPGRDDDDRLGAQLDFEELPDFADRSEAVGDEDGPFDPSTSVDELDPLGHDDAMEGLDDAHDGVDAAALPPLDEAAEPADQDALAFELPPDPRVDGRWAALSASDSAQAWIDHAMAQGDGARSPSRNAPTSVGGRLRLRGDDRGCAVVLIERDDGGLVPLDGPLQGLALGSNTAIVFGGADALAVLDGHHLTVARRDRGGWARERCSHVVAAAFLGEDHDADVLLVRRDPRGLTLARLGAGGLGAALAELDVPRGTEHVELAWNRAMETAFVRIDDVILAFRRTLDH
jgi:hypothetical protein